MPTQHDQSNNPLPPDSHSHADTNPLAFLDRRKHHRFETVREGKVFRRSTQRYAAARTRDLSAGGAMLEVESDRPFTVGEIIDLGIAAPQKAVVREGALMNGIVMRTQTLGPSRQSVAVRYLGAATMSKAA